MKDIIDQTRAAVEELISVSKLQKGDLLVIGCSSSEVCGDRIGSNSVPEVAQAIFEEAYAVAKKHGVFLAAQCCEHLNRALIIEAEAMRAYRLEERRVNVVPQPKAGGSFATAAYHGFEAPVAVEHIRAAAGLDIGNTLIGMHLREVAVPVRLSIKNIGQASLVAARTRLKFVGGQRAVYDEELL